MAIRPQLLTAFLLVLALGACNGGGVTANDRGSAEGSAATPAVHWQQSAALHVDYEVDGATGAVLARHRLINQGTDTLVGWVGLSCALDFRAYLTPERTGDPVWQTGARQVCPAALQRILIAPGDSVPLGLHEVGPVDEIVAGNPPGTYYFSATVLFEDPKFSLVIGDAGQVTLP